ncbi:hypothetical protein FVA95_01915 [Pseudonocardia sp. EV170527-09]|uniref:hypothetical protein n=1 Tax=Pseudonocardia sp. EV170527-09 TaxID=2603411 RepID=UPI0011F0EB7F|nr:hypothetical protein [Pseudonocardia sp. EV170527-09]KAA1035446.1 hypothetical protein FVA95_01915 [Pseudonocardia sp. EV170527-09]
MSAERKRARARKDATEAVRTFADAGRIAGGAVTDAVAGGVSTRLSDLSDVVSGSVHDARHALAEIVEPTPVRVRRAPWIVAVLLLTAAAVWGWATVLKREREVDPGTPVPTTPPSEDQIHGKPIGQGRSQTNGH